MLNGQSNAFTDLIWHGLKFPSPLFVCLTRCIHTPRSIQVDKVLHRNDDPSCFGRESQTQHRPVGLGAITFGVFQETVAFVIRRFIKPSDRHVVVMGSSITNPIFRVVGVRHIDVIIFCERKLQNLHSHQVVFDAQRFYIFRDNSQIFSKEGEIFSKVCPERIKEFSALGGDPRSVLRISTSRSGDSQAAANPRK